MADPLAVYRLVACDVDELTNLEAWLRRRGGDADVVWADKLKRIIKSARENPYTP